MEKPTRQWVKACPNVLYGKLINLIREALNREKGTESKAPFLLAPTALPKCHLHPPHSSPFSSSVRTVKAPTPNLSLPLTAPTVDRGPTPFVGPPPVGHRNFPTTGVNVDMRASSTVYRSGSSDIAMAFACDCVCCVFATSPLPLRLSTSPAPSPLPHFYPPLSSLPYLLCKNVDSLDLITIMSPLRLYYTMPSQTSTTLHRVVYEAHPTLSLSPELQCKSVDSPDLLATPLLLCLHHITPSQTSTVLHRVNYVTFKPELLSLS
ncbi:hypothetical protein F2Q69_00041308 [Brassica cretica]|uniref:Uncharacterized protein n=1 Tax=Brassica cretica TaxID=69181 RepID=A0A8S9NAY8_BRACR|nr:hypothetical protein F2Q69_00041308 [Brassica cretica]